MIAAVRAQAPSDGWKLEAAENGSLRILRSAAARDREARQGAAEGLVVLLLALVSWAWWLLTALGASGAAHAFPALIPLAVFLAGLALLAGAVGKQFEQEEWQVGPGLLEVRRTFLGWSRRTRLSGGTVVLSYSLYRGLKCWYLAVRPARGGEFFLQGASGLARESAVTPEDLRTLAQLISSRTGWPLRVR